MSAESLNLVPGVDPGPNRAPYFTVGVVDKAMAMLDERSAVGFEAIVELQGAIDEGAMTEAWKRLIIRHPILTCVREHDVWRPVAPPPIGPDIHQPRHDEPPVALRVTPIAGGTRLRLLCNHVAFDGMASVLLLGDLREEYNAVLEEIPPQSPDWSPRTLEALAAGPDWRTMTAAAIRGASTWWQMPASTHHDPGPTSPQAATDHTVMELGPVLKALSEERRKYHWSTDAVLVGVLEKAWSSVFGAPTADSSWLVAQDLRPTMGVTRGMGNLSVSSGVWIADPRTHLLSTIDRVHADLTARADDLATASTGMTRWKLGGDPPYLRMFRKSQNLRCYRSVSNVGQLGDSLDRWGTCSLARVWFVGPLANPPYTSFIAAGHSSSTLVSVRTSPEWLTTEHALALEQAALQLVETTSGL